MNAATGELLWEYRREFPAETRQQHELRALRGLSIYEDRILVNTGDAHIVALDGRSGAVVWDVAVTDPKQRFTYSAPGLVVRGKIISGLQSCEYFYEQKCAITAHDARTGKELWRTSTIAHPGQPGGDTWGDVPLMFRAGADNVDYRQLRPTLNLVFWSTAQAKPWTRAARGTDGDALYSNTVLALDPDTGKIVWYNQLLPGETHDMDEVFESILVDDGPRKSLFKMGKLGILWQLDRQTGNSSARAISVPESDRCRSDHRQGDVPAGHGARNRRDDRLLSEHRRFQELARDGLSPGDARLLRAAAAHL